MFEILNVQVKLLPFLLGVGIAFFGWILYWFSINITGAAVGGAAGVCVGAFASLIMGRQEFFLPFVLILGFIGLVFGIFLIRKVHRIVFFLMGVVLGILLELGIEKGMAEYGFFLIDKMWVQIVVKLGSGIISGLLLVRFSRYIVSVLTAFCGTMILLSSWDFKGGVLPGIPVFIMAVFIQVFLLRKKRGSSFQKETT